VFILYLTRQLGISPAVQGLIFAAGAPGALLAALVSARIAKRFGLGMTIMAAIFVSGAALLLIIPANGADWVSSAFLVSAFFISSFGNVTYNVNQVSLRQAITPNHLLGRMNASMRFLVWGTIPVGALIGGFLGDHIGLKPTILFGLVLGLTPFLWIFFSPVRQLREVPEAGGEIA
jgi:predicted MFS family arabinose efflux permease